MTDKPRWNSRVHFLNKVFGTWWKKITNFNPFLTWGTKCCLHPPTTNHLQQHLTLVQEIAYASLGHSYWVLIFASFEWGPKPPSSIGSCPAILEDCQSLNLISLITFFELHHSETGGFSLEVSSREEGGQPQTGTLYTASLTWLSETPYNTTEPLIRSCWISSKEIFPWPSVCLTLLAIWRHLFFYV